MPTRKDPPPAPVAPNMDHRCPIRPPPGARRNIFNHSTRRQNPAAVRPDSANIFQQPMENELVERNANGDYALYAPQTMYKHMALGLGSKEDEETEHENQMIELYGKQNNHWDSAAIQEEIKNALQSSLDRKVASLEDDKWMFEGDPIASLKK